LSVYDRTAITSVTNMPKIGDQTVGRERAEQLALAGGDDYVLLFTAPAESRFSNCSVIGNIVEGNGVEVRRDGSAISLDSVGYEHFRVS
ncbi:MAG: hypothetical protein AAFQ16_03370, partial [Pseudomonadota bacterium]